MRDLSHLPFFRIGQRSFWKSLFKKIAAQLRPFWNSLFQKLGGRTSSEELAHKQKVVGGNTGI
jgi:hypothetical protein